MDKITQGFYGSFKVPNTPDSYLCLLSRRSSEMGGMRFNSRGINEEGYVANFVETEQFLTRGKDISSFVQIRGSVPLFWRQTGVIAPPEMIKSLDAAQPYYAKHMGRLESLYGEIDCINLMSATKSGECTLSQDYQKIVTLNSNPRIRYEHIDFHGLTGETNFSAINAHIEKHEPFIKDCGTHTFTYDLDRFGMLSLGVGSGLFRPCAKEQHKKESSEPTVLIA